VPLWSSIAPGNRRNTLFNSLLCLKSNVLSTVELWGVVGGLIITTGSALIITGSGLIITTGSALIITGSGLIITTGSALIITGSGLIITTGSALIITGSGLIITVVIRFFALYNRCFSIISTLRNS
jgi:hypothetical protein